MSIERRQKNYVTLLSEIASIIGAVAVLLGICSAIMTLGEYRASFNMMKYDILNLRKICEIHADENKQQFISIRNDLSMTKQAIILHTGKPINDR